MIILNSNSSVNHFIPIYLIGLKVCSDILKENVFPVFFFFLFKLYFYQFYFVTRFFPAGYQEKALRKISPTGKLRVIKVLRKNYTMSYSKKSA